MRALGFVIAMSGLLVAGYQIYEHNLANAPRSAPERHAEEPARDLPVQSIVSQVSGLLSRVSPPDSIGGAPRATFSGAVHYSPNENLEALDRAAILGARCNHLDVAMYALTDWKLGQTLVEFANSGRKVRIYRDYEQYTEEQSRGSYLAGLFRGNRNIAIRVKRSRVLMHIKAYSDGCFLREGSANWSPSGEKQQDNTLTLTSDPNAVRAFEQEFESMWNRPDNFVIQ